MYRQKAHLCLRNELRDQVAQVSLVLGLMFKHLAAHLDHLGLGVVPRPRQFLQLQLLRRGELQVGRAELNDDLLLSRMEFAQVGCVAKP